MAIQVASSQLTPRIIDTMLLRNDVVKYTVGLFIFTSMFAISAQNQMEKDVHQLVMLMVALLCILSFAAFLFPDRLRIAIAASYQHHDPRV